MTKFEYWVSMERTCGKLLGLLILGLVVSLGVFTSGTAYSQETGGRATDIKNKLEKISGSDPIERIVALEDLLNTEDQVLRSLAVEKALQTDDRRVREVALGYLVGTQKKFVVEVTISEKAREEIKDQQVLRELEAYLPANTIVLTVMKVDKEKGQFSVGINYGGSREGFIAQDGMTVILSNLCKLRLRNVESGYLIGALNCKQYSFAAKSALP